MRETSTEAFNRTFGDYGIKDAGLPIFQAGADWERDEIEAMIKKSMERNQHSVAFKTLAQRILDRIKKRRRDERQRREEPRACD